MASDLVRIDLPLHLASGEVLSLAAPGERVHLMLRRFAGCPICNLHLHDYHSRLAEVRAAGVRPIAVFRSPVSSLASYQDDIGIELAGDPDGAVYDAVGVGYSAAGLFRPHAMGAAMRSVFRHGVGAMRPTDGMTGLVGDVLIAADGSVETYRRGESANDQWSVDDILRLVSAATT